MKRLYVRAATFVVLAVLPIALGGCIFVDRHPRPGYCYYHRC